MKSKHLLIFVVLAVIVIGGVWFLSKNRTNPDTPVLPSPQSGANSGEDQAIKEALVKHFGKSNDETKNVVVNKVAENKYARGDFQFSATEIGSFFAIKKDSKWEIPFTTAKDAIMACSLNESYNFPKAVVDQCTNPDGTIETLE